MTTQADKLMTAAEFEALGDIGPADLVRGRVFPLTRPRPRHGRVTQNIASALDGHVRPRKLGQVYGSEIGFLVERDPDTVRAPDVAFVRAEVADGHDEDQWYTHAPDLAVEIVSPNDTRPEVDEKVRLWLDTGAKAVWVIDPQRRSARLHRADGSVEEVGEQGTLRDDAVLPGFSMPLREALEG